MDAVKETPLVSSVSAAARSVSNDRGWVVRSSVIFLAYIAAAQIGYLLFVPPAIVTPVAGVVLALLYIYGFEYTPVIFVAATLSYLLNGESWGAIIVLPFAQTLQGIAGAYLLQRLGFNVLFSKLGDVLALIFVSFTVSAIVPTFGLLALYLNAQYFGHASPAITWGTWWIGMATSILIVGAFMLRWAGKIQMHRLSAWAYAETAVATALTLLLSYLLFWTHINMVFHVSLVYVLLLPLFWLALRVGPRYTTLALLLATAVAVAGTLFGVSAVHTTIALTGSRLFQVEIFLILIASIFFVLVAVEEERKETFAALNLHVGELQVALESLHSQDRIKSEFLAVLAHELRNPLAPLVSSLEVLKIKGLVNAEGAGMVEVMDNQLHRIRRLLDDLLDIARISQQKLTLQKAPIDINSVLTHSLQSVRSIVEERNQRLSVELVPSILLVNGDTTRLEQACINILNNASKFSPAGSTITLSARRVGEIVEIHVRDRGIGIEPESIESIFEPFQQGNSQRRNDGIGVGLTLARTIIELHGGTVRAVSAGRDKGSDFIISLPVEREQPQAYTFDPVVEQAERGKAFGGYRVLVVDDNEMAAKGMATLLTLKGYVAQVAHTGAEARATASAFKPHAMILDIALPDTDGYALARHFRSEGGFDGLLVALTGYGQEENKRSAFDAGFNHHLTKPVGIADLQTVLVDGLESMNS